MTDVLELPFDQYQRYGLVRALVESVRAPGERFHVLDVGGRTALLRDFLPQDRVELVDVDPSSAEGLVLGSGARLPFQDDAFDVVAAFDTLEHVPPDLRDAFVAECGRVARRYVILAGPYDHPRVAKAEEQLLEFLDTRLEWQHRYLAEHRENGLPDATKTRSILRAAGATVETFGHGGLDRWLLLMSLELYIEHEGLLHGLARKIYRFYNENLFRSDHGPEVYRHAIVAAFGGAPMPSLEGALDPVGSAPAEATQTLTQLGQEILRYDALRDTFKPEMDRLHGVVASVEKDLEEHRATIRTLEEDLEQHRASQLTTKEDLEAHRKTVRALREELDQERDSVQSVLTHKDERIGALSSDLEGHRATIETLNGLRETELKELDVRAAACEEANETLVRQNGELEDVHRQLHEARVALEAMDSERAAALVERDRAMAERDSAMAERQEACNGRDEALQKYEVAVEQRQRAMAERETASTAREAAEAELRVISQKLEQARARIAFQSERTLALASDANRLWNRFGRRLLPSGLDPEYLKDPRD